MRRACCLAASSAQRSVRMRELGEVFEKRLRSVSHGFTVSPFLSVRSCGSCFLSPCGRNIVSAVSGVRPTSTARAASTLPRGWSLL